MRLEAMPPDATPESGIRERYGRLLSCSLPCPGLDAEAFLAAAEGGPRFYWARPDGRLALAGAGAALELMAWGEARFTRIRRDARELFADACLAGEAGPRLFGGFAFRADFAPDNTWSIYAPAWFALPHFQLELRDADAWLTVNTQIPPEEDPAEALPALRLALRRKIGELQAVEPKRRANALSGIRYPMSRFQWDAMLGQATARIRSGELSKVVLARAAELRFGGRVLPLPILRYLAAQYADCYRFLFEPRPGYAFYGASPELLASARGRRLETMALAGSMRRGSDEQEDRRLGADLLGSAKDRREHQIVVDRLRQRLDPWTASLAVPSTGLLRLRNIQHLYTPMAGELKRATGVLPLVEALHPTPALGGEPRKRAMPLIRRLEPIPRGWYGAPVGWIDADLDGEFAVAIRSAVAQEARAWVYAGAGIVADSEPEREWEETELKLRPMLEAHGG